jgi:hypothetical protein
MILLIFGLALLALGIFSGAALVAAPLGLFDIPASPLLWALFPIFSALGYTLFVIGGRVNVVRGGSLFLSCLMLMLALAAAFGLVLQATSLLPPGTSTLSLWYVLAVSGVIGIVGAASLGNVPPEAAG